jgi:hypothetical protein
LDVPEFSDARWFLFFAVGYENAAGIGGEGKNEDAIWYAVAPGRRDRA